MRTGRTIESSDTSSPTNLRAATGIVRKSDDDSDEPGRSRHKWSPYYQRAFVAASQHSIGSSIVSGELSEPPAPSLAAALGYAFGNALTGLSVLAVNSVIATAAIVGGAVVAIARPGIITVRPGRGRRSS